MKTKFLLQALFLLIISSSLFAQKPITPDVDGLKLHLSDYKDFDTRVKALLRIGYTKIDWPIAKSDDWLQNSTYELTRDTIQTVLEIIHGKGKEVFKVNMYLGYSPKKWATFTNARKMEAADLIFFNIWKMINKQFEETEKSQRILRGTYKITDYDIPEAFVKGLDERHLGYFCYWGPFMKQPIELHNHNARLVKITVSDPVATTAYYKATKK
ncbi:hypothetical protein EZ456_23835 [Pedobacter psychrodurus]|uniref:Uncharacterized protein n=1 Tax=Pedobacter psychrodurus TaxID=2530456 RepID=A0A4R0PG30_9SPHI|nr:hypothetical protein [Pedobacter psychrodurus]TCD16982.1 hypothetical protein EZ456_23835 [Pedobacter psychrodurus]